MAASETARPIPQSDTRTPSARGRGRRRGRGRGRGGNANAAPRPEPTETAPNESVARRPPRRGRGGHSGRGAPHARHNFGAKLTTEAAPDVAPAGPRIVAEHADLRTRLVAELSNNDYDCIICYNTVAKKQAVWSCSRCHAVLHLACARKWAERSVQQMEERNAMHEDPEIRDAKGSWRCPGCQHTRTTIPKTYSCWCGRVNNPRPNAMPHSCGGPCTRACAWHGCAAGVCHPGPCPGCVATVNVPCFCGKQKQVAVRCSQLQSHLPEALASLSLNELHAAAVGAASCGAVCGKALACGHHTCAQPCHAGPCAPCAEPLDAACHCGRHTQAMACGDRDEASRVPDVASAWSCGEVCDEPYACGVHRCTEKCHVRTGTQACPYDPARVQTCYCGRLPAKDRTSCSDPIPACGAPCGRVLPCGHACTTPCHDGACPPCTERISQVCRCGAEKRAVPCSAADGEFLCPAPCKAQRHCGKHQCGRKCCPLSYQATLSKKQAGIPPHGDLGAYLRQLDPIGMHACDVPCGRPLSCGSHTCESSCHRGACPPCLRSSFTEVACACGRTVLEPPVPCGTQVHCSYPCTRPGPPCGHPKVPHTCHGDDTPCPPCVHLTTRRCVCGASVLPAVPCSREKVRCGKLCRAVLNCGFHTCPGACHAVPDECPPCTQTCKKPRSLCGHPCPLPCHAPSKCPEDKPCEAVIVRRCQCGHQEKMDVCGMSTVSPRRDALPTLECTPQCKVAQRNARFASALGLASGSSAGEALYDAPLLRYASAERRSALAVQEALADFIQSPRAAVLLRPQLQQLAIRNGMEPARVTTALLDFTTALAKVYGVEVEACNEQGVLRIGTPTTARGTDLRLKRARGSRVPSPLLSEYIAANPERVKRTMAAAPAPVVRTTTSAPMRFNAVALSQVPAHLAEDPASLAPMLHGASLGGRRRWRVDRSAQGGLVLCDVQLEPLSAAAVASASGAQGPYASLSAPERRLGRLADDVNAALRAAAPGTPILAELAAYHASEHRVERMYSTGSWRS